MRAFLDSVQGFASPILLLVLLAGVTVGFVVGVLPGLSTSNTAAILLPFTLAFPVEVGLVLIVSIYAGAQYGGAVPAILLNIPGEAGSVVTAMDGYPMSRQGRGAEAIGIARMASVVGGLFSTCAALLLIRPLADFALGIGPAEMFLALVLALFVVAGLVSEQPRKGLIAVLLGVLLASLGADTFTGEARFTLGFVELYDGVPFIPALVGLFALSEMGLLAAKSLRGGATDASASPTSPSQRVTDGLRTTLAQPVNLLRSSAIGTALGVLPGVGTAIASFVSYSAAKRGSKRPELFGKGSPEGIVAAEATDNAVTGGAMVPLLALGLPGSATTAVMLAALFIQGIQPGPQFLSTNPGEAYTILLALLIATLLILPLGVLLARPLVAVTRIPLQLLMPIVLVLCFVGVYATRGSLFDIGLVIVFGIVGFAMRARNYPIVPVVLGLVLGPLLEENFTRAMLLGRNDLTYFVSSTPSKILVVVLLGMVLSTMWRVLRRRRTKQIPSKDDGSRDTSVEVSP